MRDCFLDGICYQLGELHDLAELAPLAADPPLLEVYRARGLSQYAIRGTTVAESARAVLLSSLRAAAVDPATVDVVVYGSDLTGDALFTQDGINALLTGAGLTGAFPIGVSLSACANACTVLDLGAALVRTGAAQRVVCLLVAACGAERTRLMELGMSVLSDAAVACVLAAERGRYRLLGSGRASAPALTGLSPANDGPQYFTATASGLQRAVSTALAPLGMAASDLRRVLTNNYARNIQQAFLRHAGVRMEQGWLRNVARFGHAFAADVLINLADCDDAGELGAGQRCLLLGTSPSSWGAVVLERVQTTPDLSENT